jgi:hypothetical protein
MAARNRGAVFKDKHLAEFGLTKTNASPVVVRCNFCFHFGKEEKAGANPRSGLWKGNSEL